MDDDGTGPPTGRCPRPLDPAAGTPATAPPGSTPLTAGDPAAGRGPRRPPRRLPARARPGVHAAVAAGGMIGASARYG
ncbi:MAG TPA: hypothetical protein VFI47_22370, partial [Acidimicrobiales bacterium]|nr:hypothetical protein [Acidimicrobiales bacterium]